METRGFEPRTFYMQSRCENPYTTSPIDVYVARQFASCRLTMSAHGERDAVTELGNAWCAVWRWAGIMGVVAVMIIVRC